MRTRLVVWVIGLVVAGYASGVCVPSGSERAGEAGSREGASSTAVKVRSDVPAAEVYRQVRSLAEEWLEGRVPIRWQRPPNRDAALAEFAAFRQRVAVIEDSRSLIPVGGSSQQSRMFAPWARLKVNGVRVPAETDAASGPRGGPDQEVVLGTGELVLEAVDATLPDRAGVGFSLVRYYRSNLDYDGPLGPGWDHNCNQRIIARGHGSNWKELVWYTGRNAIHFQRKGDAWEPEAGAFYRLMVEGKRIVIETPELMRLFFEPAQRQPPGRGRWRLAAVASRHDQWRANVLKFRYWPGTNVLMGIEDPYGNRVRFFHNSQGRLVGLQCADLFVQYHYDESGRLSEVSVPKVAVQLARTEQIAWQYTYVTGSDGRSWLRSVAYPGELAERVYEYQLQPDGPAYGRVIEAALRSKRNLESPTEAMWKFAYCEPARGVRKLVYEPPPMLPAEEWWFPATNAPAACYASQRSIPSRGATWQWKHNAAGQPIEERRPLGGISRWEYDSDNPDPRFRGIVLAERELARPHNNPLPIVEKGVEWEYHTQIAVPVKVRWYECARDGTKRVLQSTEYRYDASDLEIVWERTGDRVVRTVRNRYGLPVVRWDGRGCATVYRYYERFAIGHTAARHGGLTAEVLSDAPASAMDAALRAVGRESIKRPARKAEGDACARISRYRYDRLGRLAGEEYPGHSLVRLWNKLDQVLAVLDTRSDLTIYDYDQALRRVSQWRRRLQLPAAKYLGERRADAEGFFEVQKFRYDPFDRLVVWNPTVERLGIGRTELPEVRYVYHPSGQLK
ncbi:MAG TPA: hypothetical protein EYP56_03645, partial [Planctomycetaceae bacterium]|nr:hypothetical protein [Planctomycetaceae bacterium]